MLSMTVCDMLKVARTGLGHEAVGYCSTSSLPSGGMIFEMVFRSGS